MTGADSALIETASEFAADISDLLGRTVVDEPPIGAQVADDRVVVGAFDDDGNALDMPLTIRGEHRLDLRVSFRCTFDFTGSFLVIEQSEFALIVPTVRHPVVRFDYDRERAWASAHVQLHAESSAVGYLRAHAGNGGVACKSRLRYATSSGTTPERDPMNSERPLNSRPRPSRTASASSHRRDSAGERRAVPAAHSTRPRC